MTREQAKQNLISIGIEAPTDEQVSAYLNQVNGESQKEKTKTEQYKNAMAQNEDLQNKLNEATAKSDTDTNRIAELEKTVRTLNMRTSLAEKGIVGENANKLIESFIAGKQFDIEALASIITEKEQNAIHIKEQTELNNTVNANNIGSESQVDKLSTAEKLVTNMFTKSESNQSIISNYL